MAMDIHYNAFISYRHHPDDIRVAAQIHRSLERYKVPKAIRKKTEGITRLFRDKEELPITSNLTDDITAALNNSDFLIVICSVHTKESIWVQREIETFLKTHHRSKVLTVLVSGEPYDVIPDILLHEDITDPATGEVTRVPVEPLSCDWRLGRRKARHEELPRLAAVLLGCGYDELRQRQRQYRMKKMIAGFSAALTASLCLTAYFIYTSLTIQKANENLQAANIQIQANLDEALRNQSRHFATASGERLEAGDRLTAISLAMEALPNGQNQRPYVPEAELALSNALGIYGMDSDMVAMGAVDPGSIVTDFQAAGDVIYLTDKRNLITVWDTDSLQKLAVIDLPEDDISELKATAEGNLLVKTQSFRSPLYCCGKDGSILWQTKECMDTAFSEDGQTLLVLCRNEDGSYSIFYLDPDTGTQVREPLNLPAMAFLGPEPRDFYQDTYRKDMPLTVRYSTYGDNRFMLVDPVTGEASQLLAHSNSVRCAAATDDGKLLLMVSDGSGAMNGIVYNMHIFSPARSDIYCYDSQSGELLWQSEISSCIFTKCSTMAPIGDGSRILCQTGNTFSLLSSATGEILAQCQADSGVLDLDIQEEQAFALLQNGATCMYTYSTNTCSTLKYMEGDLIRAQISNGYWCLQDNGTQVTLYNHLPSQALWVFKETLPYANSRAIAGDKLALLGFSELCLFDTRQQKVLWRQETNSSGEILGFSGDGETLWIQNGHSEILGFDVTDGSPTSIDISREDGTFKGLLKYHGSSASGLLALDKGQALVTIDLNTGKQTVRAFLTEEELENWEYSHSATLLGVAGDFAWVHTGAGNLHEISLSGNTSRILKTGLTTAVFLGIQEDTAVLAADNELLLTVPGGEIIRTIPLPDTRAVSLCFREDMLLVLCDDGDLYRFDREGTLLSQTALALYTSFYTNASRPLEDPMSITWDFTEDGKLILNIFSMGNVIDCTHWALCSYVTALTAYLPDQDLFLSTRDQGFTAYPRYTVEESMELARQQLKGYELSQAQKDAYGID